MDRTVSFHSAFHRCTPDPSTNQGIGGVAIVFRLTDGTRGVSWTLLTDWYLPPDDFVFAAPECPYASHKGGRPPKTGPTPGPVTWHWPEPMDGDRLEPDSEDCEITGGKCWSRAGYRLGDHAFDALASSGEEGLWSFFAKCIEDQAREAQR